MTRMKFAKEIFENKSIHTVIINEFDENEESLLPLFFLHSKVVSKESAVLQTVDLKNGYNKNEIC